MPYQHTPGIVTARQYRRNRDHPHMNTIDLEPILAYYEATPDGQIRRKTTGRTKAQTYNQSTGYLTFGTSIQGKQKQVLVHRFILYATSGPPPKGKNLALHRNGIRTDNRAENLYWGDHSENTRDAVRHGTHGGQ